MRNIISVTKRDKYAKRYLYVKYAKFISLRRNKVDYERYKDDVRG